MVPTRDSTKDLLNEKLKSDMALLSSYQARFKRNLLTLTLIQSATSLLRISHAVST